MSRFARSSASSKSAAVPEAEAYVIGARDRPQGLLDLPPLPDEKSASPQRPVCHVEFAHFTATNHGKRHENEDRWVTHRDNYAERDFAFTVIGVLDGHDSDLASDLVSRELPGLVSKRLQENVPVVEAYTLCMSDLENKLKKLHATAGTCVLSCTIAGRYVWCSNLGDCRAAFIPLEAIGGSSDAEPEGKLGALPPAPRISGTLTWLSKDQKASMPDEVRRIEAAGGTVIDGRVEGLEPSRTLGDFDVKGSVRRGVISIVPEVRRHEIGDGTRLAQGLIICATDGVWDVLSGQDVCNLIVARKELVRMQASMGYQRPPGADRIILDTLAEDFVQFAIAKGSKDDCTAVVALLSMPPDGSKASSGRSASKGRVF